MFGLCFDLMLYRYRSGQVRNSPAHCDTVTSSLGRCLYGGPLCLSELHWACPRSRALFVSVGSCQPCAAYISVMCIPKLHLLLVFAFSWILGLDSARLSILQRKKSFTKHFGINTVLIVALILQMPLQISDLEFYSVMLSSRELPHWPQGGCVGH